MVVGLSRRAGARIAPGGQCRPGGRRTYWL